MKSMVDVMMVEQINQFFKQQGIEYSLHTIAAVSYTHLDVYKRQHKNLLNKQSYQCKML